MSDTKIYGESHESIAPDYSITAKTDLGESSISLNSQGCGPMTGTGTIEISANGSVLSQAGNAIVQLSTSITEQSSVVVDGGLLGNVTIANSAPVGTAQTIELDGKLGSIEISNGNIPGAFQTMKMESTTQSIELSVGGLPFSPTINLSPTGITLSCGPANSITIGPAGINIKGLVVEAKGETLTTVGGSIVNIKADGLASVGGTMVKIQ